MEITCIYYSANREHFEDKIIENLKKNCPFPIVSVTQNPMNLGKNICVGNVGNSYINEYRQILLALKEVKTEYVISAESDFLYPKSYFEFVPTGENIYRSDNVWIVFPEGDYFKKPYSEGAQIAKTSFLIKFIEHYLDGLPEWFDGRPQKTDKFYNTYQEHQKELWALPFTFFHSEPCVSFKTGKGVRMNTKTEGVPVSELPVWGEVNNLRKIYG